MSSPTSHAARVHRVLELAARRTARAGYHPLFRWGLCLHRLDRDGLTLLGATTAGGETVPLSFDLVDELAWTELSLFGRAPLVIAAGPDSRARYDGLVTDLAISALVGARLTATRGAQLSCRVDARWAEPWVVLCTSRPAAWPP